MAWFNAMRRSAPPIVLTHRGLEPSKRGFFEESTLEAFSDHLDRGFGVEFDVAFLTDGILVTHDTTLRRASGGKAPRPVAGLTANDVARINGFRTNGRLGLLDELLRLISGSPCALSALHLKGAFQQRAANGYPFVDRLLETLARFPELSSRLLVFDVLPAVAAHMKHRNPEIQLAPSVAHPYDIARYGAAVGRTLITMDEAIARADLYSWVWLDEWDRTDSDGGDKQLYRADVFATLRAAGLRIAVVSPELHATSPGLLGGEAHPDGRGLDRLLERLKSIISLSPDAICTDYPEEVRLRVADGLPPAA